MLGAIVDRLKDQCGLRTVGAALELAAIVAPPAAPAAYVVPVSDQAAPSARVGAVEQGITEIFGVLLIQRSAASGTAKVDDVDALRNAVRTRLLGWTPAAGCTPIQYVGGAIVDVRPNEVWRLLRFSTRYLVRNP